MTSADVANAAAHRDDVGADFAVIVSREFAGFKGGASAPQIIKDCAAASGSVTILTVDSLIELYRTNRRLALPLDLLPEVIRPLESPDEKLNRIHEIADPTGKFDWRKLLQQLWDLQQGQAQGDVVPYRALWQGECERGRSRNRRIRLASYSARGVCGSANHCGQATRARYA